MLIFNLLNTRHNTINILNIQEKKVKREKLYQWPRPGAFPLLFPRLLGMRDGGSK